MGRRGWDRLAAAGIGALLAAGGLAGCGGDDDDSAGDASAQTTTTTPSAESATAAETSCEDATLAERSYILCTAGDQSDQGLVVALHGRGSTAEQMQTVSELDRYAVDRGLAVAYPESLDGGWGDDTFTTPSRPRGDEDVTFVDDLIETLRSDSRIGDQPIGLVGFSNGASMALRYAAERPEEVGAVVSVAGQLPRDPAVVPSSPVALLQIYGSDDPLRDHDTGIPESADRQPGDPTPTLSTADTVAAFVDVTEGDVRHEGPTESDPAPEDETSLRTERWTHDGDTVAVLHTVVGGGHTWPGAHAVIPGTDDFGPVSQDLDAGAEAIAFVLDSPT